MTRAQKEWIWVQWGVRRPAEGALPELPGQASTETYLIDATLNYDEECQSYCMEAEENIVDIHRVHSTRITE